MLISSDAGSGQIVSSEDTRFYDDIGCLAADWVRRPPNARAFVRIAGGRWLEARDASYGQPDDARTTMGSGVVAFASIAEARAVDRDGRALTFDDVIRLAGGSR